MVISGLCALQIELKLESTTSESEFTVENALYFATMSKIAYLPKAAAEDALVGNDTSTGMGFTQFHWFEVCEITKLLTNSKWVA